MYNFYFTVEHADVAFIVAKIEARTAREAWEIAGYPADEFPMIAWENRLTYVDIEFNVPPRMIAEFKGETLCWQC